jgi:hypothetical protein
MMRPLYIHSGIPVLHDIFSDRCPSEHQCKIHYNCNSFPLSKLDIFKLKGIPMHNFLKFLLISILLCPVTSLAQKLVYRKIQDKDTSLISITITQNGDSYTYHSESVLNNGIVSEDATITNEGLAQTYSYSNEGEQYTVQCRQENGELKLFSRHNGKEQNKTLKLKQAWRQVFPHDLSSFVQGRVDTMSFESVGLYGPGALNLGGMQAAKLNEESVTVNGTQHTGVHVRVALAGIFARFWHADYWFRKSDGRFLKGIWVEKPGAKPCVTELIKERM